MPKKEINDYIFYKIVCLDSNIDLCYVGSTANWKARNYQHKSNCKSYNCKIYKTIRENGGWCNFKMIQIGTREKLTKRQAEQIEEEYRVELKANMNTRNCYLTEEQKQNYYEANKDKYKKYYEENKDKIKEYHEKNKDKIKEYHQIYNEENKDKIKEYRKKWCEENKDKIKEYNEKNKDKIKEYYKKRYEKNNFK